MLFTLQKCSARQISRIDDEATICNGFRLSTRQHLHLELQRIRSAAAVLSLQLLQLLQHGSGNGPQAARIVHRYLRRRLFKGSYGYSMLKLAISNFVLNLAKKDIEPSVEYGSYIYELMASCIRVYRSGAQSCNDTKEECCNMGSSNIWTNIWSMKMSNNSDFLLTASESEKNALIQSGAWSEVPHHFHTHTHTPLTLTLTFLRSRTPTFTLTLSLSPSPLQPDFS